jgi:hypothetical protein
MGIGPQGLGSMGMSKNSRPCGSPLNKNGKTKRSAPMDLKTMEARKTSLLDINGSPITKKDTCWDGYKAQGQKKSPSGKKTASGKAKMVNNCVKV